MSEARSLYFLPIGGTAMAPLAGLLAAFGHRVEGVDSHLYPPMSTLLEELEIPVRLGFDADRIPPHVGRVIIGNAVPRSNPEVQAVLERGIPHLSQAEAVAHYVLGTGREGLVVAGTHGKTTTTAMVSWILEATGADPTSLIGGLPSWNPRGFRLGRGRWLVIEGDEYNAAFFDRGPKFLHYRPRIFVLGPVEFDHADLYPNFDAVLTAFAAGTALVPRDGAVVVNGWSADALDASRNATAPRIVVGETDDCDLVVAEASGSPDGSTALLRWQGDELPISLPVAGRHNLQNAAMAVAAAIAAGVEAAAAVEAMAGFPGVARRLEVVGEVDGITVVDDFAHHPTALGVTVEAIRQRWPGRRLVLAFEPRSLTAGRAALHNAYLQALSGVEVVLIAPIFHYDRLADDERLDRAALGADLSQGGALVITPDGDEDPAAALAGHLQPGDVVVGCSSGDFSGFHRRVIELRAGGTS
jgi:UDP-N-acetylmuramate: L-alanyl-gamma-D-glutamyl-meso-diaminopimelate ligase